MRIDGVLLLALLPLVGVGCDEGGPPPTSGALPDTADQVLYGVAHNVTIDGVLRIRLEADTIYFYETVQSAEMLGVVVQFYTPEGVLTSTVRSREGTYQWRSGDMEARGAVVARTPDERVLTTEVLRFSRLREEISGPEAFVFDGPDGHLEGDGFTSDPDFRNVLTDRPRRGRVRDTDPGVS
jgi:LPS export ABC transporter protein LptC